MPVTEFSDTTAGVRVIEKHAFPGAPPPPVAVGDYILDLADNGGNPCNPYDRVGRTFMEPSRRTR